MTWREEKTKAINEIRASGNAGLSRSFVALLNAHIAECQEALESAQEQVEMYRLQGRAHLAREILRSITNGSAQ